MNAPYPVTGVATKGVYPRYEIDKLKGMEKQFTLFIQGWSALMQAGYQPLAAQFEQIGGIHGMPYAQWSGDPDEENQLARGPWLGYCNHASILFPTWHRVYVMLLEQAISEEARAIAGRFAHECTDHKEAEQWLQAARELRFPYWDWTRRPDAKTGLPKVLIQKDFELLVPNGRREPHRNILAFYKFNQRIDGFNDRLEDNRLTHNKCDCNCNCNCEYDTTQKQGTPIAYFRQWDRTYRWPNSTPVDVREDSNALARAMNDPEADGGWVNLIRDVAALFNFPLDIPTEQFANAWDEFSNTTFQSSRPDVNPKKPAHSPFIWGCPPIEQPHNNVHLVVGGIGHMGDNDTAGFDPIFFLHHCNVDRIFAFWEHVYPDYVAGTNGYLDIDGQTRNPFTQAYGTYIESSTQTVDDDTGLTPFRNVNYTYWAAKDTHLLVPDCDPESPKNKYYTYDPIEGISLEQNSSLEDRKKQQGKLQKYFGQTYQTKMRMEPEIFTRQPASLPKGHEHVSGFRHFIIDCSLSTFALSGSYSLHVFLQTKSRNISVGMISVLGRGRSTSCGNCNGRRAAGTRVRGVITVPHSAIALLLSDYTLDKPDTTEEEIITAIKESLKPSLVLPSGVVHCEARQRDEISSQDKRLPAEATPSLRLLSANISKETKYGEEAPFHFYNWQDHEFVDKHWIHATEGQA